MIDWEKIKENYTLEDMLNLLERNKPRKNNKLFIKWENIYYDILDELEKDEEHPSECDSLIEEAINFLKEQKQICCKGMIIYK